MLKDVDPDVMEIARSRGHEYVSITSPYPITGHSYEMAFVNSVMGEPGIYTGAVSSYDGDSVEFMGVLHEDVKEAGYPDVVTSDDLPILVNALPTGRR